MGLGTKKTKVNQTQTNQFTNTYGWQTPPETADVTALRGQKATLDPSIPYRYANMKEEFANTYKNPFGAYTTPAVRDAATRSNNERLSMAQGQAMAEGHYAADNMNFARQAAIAEMTAPRMVQTGGTSNGTVNGTTTQSGGFWSGLITQAVGGAATGAGMALG
jgi:hypothetical protein